MQRSNPGNFILCVVATTVIGGAFLFLLAHALREYEEARTHGNHTAHNATNTTTPFLKNNHTNTTHALNYPDLGLKQLLLPVLACFASVAFLCGVYHITSYLLAGRDEDTAPLVVTTEEGGETPVPRIN
ncbi:MAG TPA: hypothetical protein VI844_02555 [Coxiellaceae bacterium]|nr:hypothetical protein [Coxiellaceae bacterium]